MLPLIAQGKTDRGMAEELFVTRKTVEAHVRSVLGKLDLPADATENPRVHAVLVFLRHTSSRDPGSATTGVSPMPEVRTAPSVAHMFKTDEAPLWLHLAAVAVILAPTFALLALHRRIGTMNTAAGLVIWGGLAACGEHGYWAMRLAPAEALLSEGAHAGVHYFMAGVYAAIAGVLVSVIALTLLRERRRAGWFAVLFALLVGGGLELVMNGPTGRLYHHVGLYGYVVAWLAALVLAFKPTFLDHHKVNESLQ